MATSNITKVTARVNRIIGAHGTAFDATVSDDRFIQEEIYRAIVETESEVVRALCESYHPMRSTFMSWSADLAHGDQLPSHIGQIEAVRIEPYDTGSYVIGESTSRENIRLWRANTNNVFDTIAHNANGSSLSGYYNITGETITFTGFAAQVNSCSYVPDYATPALQIDDQFEGTLVAGSVVRLNKLGVPQELIATYGTSYANFLNLIRTGMDGRPSHQEAQKVE